MKHILRKMPHVNNPQCNHDHIRCRLSDQKGPKCAVNTQVRVDLSNPHSYKMALPVASGSNSKFCLSPFMKTFPVGITRCAKEVKADM